MRLQKLFIRVMCNKKVYVLYLIGIAIFFSMVLLEINNIRTRHYPSFFQWISDECILLLLLFFMVFYLYNTYRNCWIFMESEIHVFTTIGVTRKRVKRYVNQIFVLGTAIVGAIFFFVSCILMIIYG